MLTTHVPAVVAMNLTQSSPCTAPQVVARAFRPPPPATRPPRAGFSDSADVSVIGSDEYYSPSEAVSAAGWVGTLRAYAVEVAALFEPNGAAASAQMSSVATEARLCELFPPHRSVEGRAVAAGLGALYTLLRAQAARLPTVRTPPSKIAPNPALFSASSAFAASAAAAAQSLTEPPLGAGGATAGITTADDARPSSVCGRSYASARSPSPPLVRRAAPIVPTAAHTPLPLSRLNISSATSFGSPPVDSIDAPSPPPVAPLEGPQPLTRHLVRWGASCHGSVDTAALATPGGTARGGALSGYVGREDRAGGATASLPPPRSRAPSLPAEAQALPAQELRAASREPREHFLRDVKPLETWMLSLKRVPSPPQNASHGVSATQSMPRRSAPSVSGATAAQMDGGRTVAATSSTGSGVCCFGDGGIPSRSSVEREQRRQCYRSASCQSAVAPRQSQQQPQHQQPKHTQHSQYTQMQYSHHRSGLPTGASAAAAAVAAAAGPPAGFASLDSMSLLRAVQQPHRRSTSPPGGARPTRHSHRTAGSEAAHHSEASGADYVGVGSGMVGALGIAGRVDRAAAVRSGSITTRTRPSSPCPLYGPLSQDKWSRQVAQLRQDHQASRTRTDYL